MKCKQVVTDGKCSCGKPATVTLFVTKEITERICTDCAKHVIRLKKS